MVDFLYLCPMIDLNNFDAVIFDMDGVLTDSEPLWKIAMEEVFHSVGCKLTRKDFQKTVGLRIDEVCEYWYQHEAWTGATPKEVENKIMLRMVELIRENGEPLPGVMETTHYLREKGVKIGLATSSYTVLIDAVLDTLGIRDRFDEIHYTMMGYYKLMVILFNVTPYLVLRFVKFAPPMTLGNE